MKSIVLNVAKNVICNLTINIKHKTQIHYYFYNLMSNLSQYQKFY